MLRKYLGLWIAALTLAGCSSGPAVGPGERLIGLPGGRQIVTEVASRPEDMARGMMYRDSLAADRGMLFIHPQAGRVPYWMHNVKIPLDIVWLDQSRRVVEISANTPPCDGKPASDCPSYGGTKESAFVLEMAGGMAAKYGVTEGVVLDF